ncbi:MAG: outer membrane protein assembly factor BamA, partial [Alphaproteobacteria bacterium]|nr:outer membrane protein assembly factor BamA [Alphaproteobacteria bacterium]
MTMHVLKSKAWGFALLLAMLSGLFTVIAPVIVLAQTTPPPNTAPKTTSLKFSQIVVRGNQRIESSTIRNFANILPGKLVTPGQINAAFQNLKASGLFEEVSVTPRGNRLVIVVREFPTINRINFERNKRIKDERLIQVITSQPRRTYSPAQAEADAAEIVEAYRQSGRFNAEVRPKIIRRSDNRVDLVFEVFEGKVVEIQRLSFVGNRNFSDRRLRRILSTKQAGILRALIKRDTFIADRIEFDKQVLRDFYLSRG